MQYISVIKQVVLDSFYLNFKQVHRLFTHEDGIYYHIHKILGFIILGHFGYRIINIFRYGNLGFNDSNEILGWIILHALLHITSFQFIISNRRNKVYNIIWPEMRWHSLIFAYRSLLSILVIWLGNNGIISSIQTHIIRCLLVIMTMISADYVTNIYKGEPTMRENPYPSYVSKYFIQFHNLFYSISQVYATLNIIIRGYDEIFLTLVAIQTAPFCMTLVKKGLLRPLGWHVYYTLALGINYYYGRQHGYNDLISPKLIVLFFVMLRFRCNVNKYILWTIIMSIYTYQFMNTKSITSW